MKKFLIILAILAVCQIAKAVDTNSPDPNLYLQKIKQLEKTIETQQKRIRLLSQKLEEQEKENKRLRYLLSQAGIDISPQINKNQLNSNSENVINMSLAQLHQFITGSLTTAQKREQYKNYGGKLVQWTSKVTDVLPSKVFFIYTNVKPIWKAHINVNFQETQKQKLLSLNKGLLVTYQGRLPENYDDIVSLSSGHLSLTDGRVVTVAPSKN